jgi:hypothetical protein
MRLAQALTMVARVSHRAEPDAAERALDEVVAMGPEILTSMLAIALPLRAECRFAAGDPRAALEFLYQTLVAFGDNQYVHSVAHTAAAGASIFAALGEPAIGAALAGARHPRLHGRPYCGTHLTSAP